MNIQTLRWGAGRNAALDEADVRRGRAVSRPFLLTMAIVAMLAGVYYAFIATPMYVSRASFSIHSPQPAVAAAVLATLSSGSGGDKVSDIVAVREFIHSDEMARALDRQFQLRTAYSQMRMDPLRRIPARASDEAFLRFYRRMVTVDLDRQAGIVEIRVRSFDDATAPAMAEAILTRTEAFVDGMTQRVRSETMRSAQAELDRARSQAEAARLAVASFRGSTSSVDPAAAGAQIQGGQAALEAQAGQIQAELASVLTFSRADAPVVRQLRARLAAVQAQIAQRRSAQGAGGAGRTVTSYEALIAQRVSAEQRLVSATTAFDTARAVAQQREKYVVRVVSPHRPDRPTEPKRLTDFLMVMVFALAGYAIISLAIAGIRDHRGV